MLTIKLLRQIVNPKILNTLNKICIGFLGPFYFVESVEKYCFDLQMIIAPQRFNKIFTPYFRKL